MGEAVSQGRRHQVRHRDGEWEGRDAHELGTPRCTQDGQAAKQRRQYLAIWKIGNHVIKCIVSHQFVGVHNLNNIYNN
jgi:hypothetical protein